MADRKDTIIQLRRTKDSLENTQSNDIYFGELIYSEQDNAVVVGNSTDDNTTSTIYESKAIKFVDQEFVDKGTFYKEKEETDFYNNSERVDLTKNDGKTLINPRNTSDNIIYKDGTTLESKLDDIYDGVLGDESPYALGDTKETRNAKWANSIKSTSTTEGLHKILCVLDNDSEKSDYKTTCYYDVKEDDENQNGIAVDMEKGIIYGAAWNDISEVRKASADFGYCVVEVGNGRMMKSDKHCQAPGFVISDTYGQCLGVPEGAYKPVAIAGRVLVYANRKDKLKLNDAVCVGKHGKIDKMSFIEKTLFPERILGTVSEIPKDKTWNDIKIDGRVWINLR